MKNEIVFDKDRLFISLNGKEIKLTKKEFVILKFLYDNQDKTFTREQIIEKIFPEYDAFDRTIDAFIKLIRKKIGSERIKTIYKRGYQYIK